MTRNNFLFLGTFRHEILCCSVFILRDSRLDRAELINHHPVFSKTLFLFGYLKYLTRLRIFNFFITPLHLKFAHALYLDYLDIKILKIYEVHTGVPSSGNTSGTGGDG